MERRHSRAVPGFNGQNFIHTNPLPAVSNLPSFSYGSPQNTLPKQPTLKDTRLRMGDALQQADEAAKKRIEAAAIERKKTEEARNATKEKGTNEQAESSAKQTDASPRGVRRTPRGRKASETPGPVRRSLRSQSVASRGSDDERDRRSESVADFEGDATVNEIHDIINRAQQPTTTQPSVLRSRSVNIHRSLSPEVSAKPRSAMKGARDSAQRTPANARARRNGHSQNDVDVTYNEEFNGMGQRAHSPSNPTTSARLERIQENDSLGDENSNTYTRAVGDANSDRGSTGFFSRLFNVFGRNKSRNSDIYDRQGASWFSNFKKNFILFAYFVKHLLRSGVVIGLFCLVISGIAWSLYNIREAILPLRIPFSIGYTAPANLPATSQELYARLVEVERHLERWTQVQKRDTAAWKSLSSDEKSKRQAIETELASMTKVLSKLSGVTEEFRQHQDIYLANNDATKTVLSNVQASLAALDKSVKGSAHDSASMKKHLSDMQGQIDVVREEIVRLEFAINLNQKALQRFETELPQQLAVKLDPRTGKLAISPEIWRHLQSLLRKDIEQYVETLPSGSKKDKPNTAPINSWDDFLAKNEAKLRGYIGDIEDQKWRSAVADDIVISKSKMMRLMEDELASLRSQFEENNRGLYSKLVSEAQKAAAAAVKRSGATSAAASASKYGDALIQAALHQYSATVLQKPDYALRARGTRILPHLTSSTYVPSRKGALGFFSSYWEPEGNSPAHVLTEHTAIGDCWTFPTSSGQVSILLAQKIYPSDVTVDHVPQTLLGDGRSAPRDMEFWVRIDDAEVREQVHRAAAIALGDQPSSPNHGLTVNNFVRVAAFTYDIDSAYPTQTFELGVNLQKLGAKVEDVSFRVLSNWGNEAFTSIYRVRVHGAAAEL